MCVRLYASRENSLYYYLSFLLAVFAPIPLAPLCHAALLLLHITYTQRTIWQGIDFTCTSSFVVAAALCLNNSMWYTCMCALCVWVCVCGRIVFLSICLASAFPLYV